LKTGRTLGYLVELSGFDAFLWRFAWSYAADGCGWRGYEWMFAGRQSGMSAPVRSNRN
jgi:hypothetical protein